MLLFYNNFITEALALLQSIVLFKTLLNVKTHFLHTGNLEVYHTLYNRYIPKCVHFTLNCACPNVLKSVSVCIVLLKAKF